MSLWKSIASSSEIEQSMKQYYNEIGFAEIRVYMAQWIEERIMSECITPHNSEAYHQLAQQFIADLKDKLVSLSADNLVKYKLAKICAQTRVVEIYNHLRNGLHRELELVGEMPQTQYMFNTGNGILGNGINSGLDSIGVGGIGGSMIGVGGGLGVGGIGGNGLVGGSGIGGLGIGMVNGDEMRDLYEKIRLLQSDVERLWNTMQTYLTSYETFCNLYNNFNQTRDVATPQDTVKLQLEERYAVLVAGRESIILELSRIAQIYHATQEKVISELKNWQRNQALAGNGAPFNDNLSNIQGCIEALFDVVCKVLSYWENFLKRDRTIQESDNTHLIEIINHLRRDQEILVISAFIVEKQPPQVMKTNTRFAAIVRWLIGPKLEIHKNCPTVTCVILSEAQAQRHSAQRTMGECSTSSGAPASSGEILNNVGTMEYNQTTGAFSANFRNMQLKKIKRAEKKGTESVMDEKFALLFYTTTIVNNYEIRVWTLSLPVVVIVHGNQEPQSWATITWDNAFSDIVREPFQVPDRVSWSQLSYALNTKFASATQGALTQDNLDFLYEKLFRNDNNCGDQKDYITWAQFCKEPLPDRAFTFWDWFFAIMKLTKDHLPGLWKAGRIVGFINKAKVTDHILRTQNHGTFLLRFSDSELGGITVAFVDQDIGKVLMLAPWTARDLNIRGLADRIHDLDVLCYLYPQNIPRDDAFREFYSNRIEEQTRRDGYVANTIRAHVPAIEEAMQNATPHHHIQSPHPQDIPMTNDYDPLEVLSSFQDTSVHSDFTDINW